MKEESRWRRYMRFWGPNVRADVDDEMQFHIDALIAENRETGLSSADAEQRARERFGDYSSYERSCRQIGEETRMRTERREYIGTLLQDVRFGMRQLRSNALLSVIAIVTLALGIGANTTIFSVVNTVLLTPLPYHDADRIVVSSMSIPEYRDIRERSQSFDDMTAWASNLYTIRGDQPDQIRGAIVMPNFFTMLASPALGRAFTESEATQPLAVISDGLWRRRYGSSANVIGQTIDLSGSPHTIIGVMPRSFAYPDVTFDVWVPMLHAMTATPAQLENRSLRIFKVIAHMKAGMSLARVNAEALAISAQIAKEHPDTNTGVAFGFQSLSSRILGDTVPRALMILLGAVGMVLLIACANVANLLLGMTTKRSREIAVRSALGAPRTRLVKQLLTESVVLAAIGAACGVGLSVLTVRALPRFASDVPRINEVLIDTRVLLFALAAAFATAILFGIVPALRGSRGDVRDILQEGRGGVGTNVGGRLRSLIVAAEVAISVIVLVGAGLLTQSLLHVMHQDIGMNPDHLVSANVGLFYFASTEERIVKYDQLMRAVARVDGVEVIGTTSALPPQSAQRFTNFTVTGRTPDAAEANGAYWIAAGTDYFKALQTKLLRGRAFDDKDRAGNAPVVIISESLARALFDTQNPIGRQMRLTNQDAGPAVRTIVGVAGDIRYNGVEDPTQTLAIYTPFTQTPFMWTNLMLRTSTPAARLARPLRAAIAAVDPRMVPGKVDQHSAVISDLYAQRRFITFLLGSFAMLALVLAAVGIYGVIANSVMVRRREIGVRIALGARPHAVLRQVIGRATLLVSFGVAGGIVGALWLTRLLTALLYNVKAADPVTFAIGGALMLGVALIASGIPAWRAARLDPLVVLRE